MIEDDERLRYGETCLFTNAGPMAALSVGFWVLGSVV